MWKAWSPVETLLLGDFRRWSLLVSASTSSPAMRWPVMSVPLDMTLHHYGSDDCRRNPLHPSQAPSRSSRELMNT